MTMILRSITRIIRNGKLLNRVILVQLLMLLCLLEGCENCIGTLRGDWSQDLTGAYCLCRINSHSICIAKREEIGESIVINNYFVTGYIICDSLILLKGISTNDSFIIDEEREKSPTYYIIDTTSEKKHGPFHSETELFTQTNNDYGLFICSEWLDVLDPPLSNNY